MSQMPASNRTRHLRLQYLTILPRLWSLKGKKVIASQIFSSNANPGVRSQPVMIIEPAPYQKISPRKPLIPLPPTGCPRLFFANSIVVQTDFPPSTVAGQARSAAIARDAKVCKKMQDYCTTLATG